MYFITDAGLRSEERVGQVFNEYGPWKYILIKRINMRTFSCKKMKLAMSFAKCWPFWLRQKPGHRKICFAAIDDNHILKIQLLVRYFSLVYNGTFSAVHQCREVFVANVEASLWPYRMGRLFAIACRHNTEWPFPKKSSYGEPTSKLVGSIDDLQWK